MIYDAGHPKPVLCDSLEGWGVEGGRGGVQDAGDACLSVANSYSVQSLSRVLTLYDPMDCSMPGLPVHHQLQELTQKLMSIESVMPSISSSVVLFSSRLQPFPASGALPMNLFFTSGSQSIGSFSFSISPSNKCSGLISFRMDWFDLLAIQGTL